MQTNFSRAHNEHIRLLFNTKSTVEHLFLTNISTASTINEGNQFLTLSADEVLQLHSVVEQIFNHGLRLFKPDQSPDSWPFIEGLNWLNPSMTVSVATHGISANPFAAPRLPIPAGRIKSDRALSWIYENLADHKLLNKLKFLVSDSEHLNTSYEVWAFLQNTKYTSAFLLCLRALEINQPNLLTQIDEELLRGCNGNAHEPSAAHLHKRSTSHPNFSFVPVPVALRTTAQKSLRSKRFAKQLSANDPPRPRALRSWSSLPILNDHHSPNQKRCSTISQQMPIAWQSNNRKSLPITSHKARIQNVPSFSYKMPEEPAKDFEDTDSSFGIVPITLVKCDDIKIHFDWRHVAQRSSAPASTGAASESETTTSGGSGGGGGGASGSGFFSFLPILSRPISIGVTDEKSTATSPSLSSFLSGSAPTDFVNAFMPMDGEKLQTCASSDGDLVRCMSPACSSLHFHAEGECAMDEPMPSKVSARAAQSLASFLQTGQFSRAHNDLERENAHFSVCEAMISAIEQMKCKRWMEEATPSGLAETPTRKRIRLTDRGRSKRNLSTQELPADGQSWHPVHGRDLNDKYRRTVMSASASSSSTGSSMASTSSTGASIHHRTTTTSSSGEEDVACVANVDAAEGANCIGNAPNVNDECQAYAEWGGSSLDNWSAESVALSLIAKFSDKQMPRARDLQWLVADHPQSMLPLPGSWTVNPDEPYTIPFTRGTRDWAPPRAQIIFTMHPKKDRKSLLFKQNHRCAGCGMKVAAEYSHCFRYCEYLGRFHCTNCHRNQISVIPARVLDSWDFSVCPVSVFAYRLLEKIWSVPLFRVYDLNRELYARVKALRVARQKRQQLTAVREFVVSCRFAEEDGTKQVCAEVASHIYNELDVWSMADFTAVRRGSFAKDINWLTARCEKHVLGCELCLARGFICALCPRKQTIFPWQPKVRRCLQCGVCVHESCWQDDCAKCERLRKRN